MDKIALENTKKKLIFRCAHRGTKEMDLFLGQFAAHHVPTFNVQQVRLFEEFITNSDPDIYNWITRREDIPAQWDNQIAKLLMAFKLAK